MSKSHPKSVDVEIYDQRYSIVLRADIDEKDVRTLAAQVDTRMREIASVASTADSLKIAVLTALHLAQELRELRERSDEGVDLIAKRSDEWSHVLEELLR